MTFTLKIQLTKTLPPENIPPTVFNIIFKKFLFNSISLPKRNFIFLNFNNKKVL